jgi:hypothetical protein
VDTKPPKTYSIEILRDPLKLDWNPSSSTSDFKGFRCGPEGRRIVFEPNSEHRATLRNAHDLCRLGYGVVGSCSGEADCGNRRSGHRICLLDDRFG